MYRRIAVAVLLAIATATTAWAMSELLSKPIVETKADVRPGGGYGGYNLPPARLTPLW